MSDGTNSRTAGDIAKRAFDILFAAIAIIVVTPIVLIAAAIIMIDTPGSPFFIQRRVGKNGRMFSIVKLRGMYIDAKDRFPQLYEYSASDGLDFYFHRETDPRITRVGRWTRRTSIDELPNFVNVLLGQMSLVGPRPEVPQVMALYGSYRDAYLSVQPGITCLSKCTGRDRLTKRETIEMDINYVRSRSFLLDMKIIWMTIRSVINLRNVH